MDGGDHRLFLDDPGDVVEILDPRRHAYGLMTNHDHLIAETQDGNPARVLPATMSKFVRLTPPIRR